ncbi:capsule assembly Wzi family protein [Spirosoma pomorum]
MKNSLSIVLHIFFSIAITHIIDGQSVPDTITARQTIFAEISGLGSSVTQTPFWFRSRQYGIIPLTSPAGIVQTGITRQFGDYRNPQKAHVKVGFESVANFGSNSRLILPVAYASLLLGKFELYAGRRREVFGLVDTLLTSGSYAWSGNALPIYKIQLGTRGYVPIGFTKGVIAINGLYAHGWFNNTDSIKNSFLHQKALFARISLFKNKVRLYGGVTHYAQWGGYSNASSNSVTTVNGKIPNSLQTYRDIVLVRQPSGDSTLNSAFDLSNQAGNHLGSIDVALELDKVESNWYLYYQHPFEDKSGVAFQNMPDGLYGIRWKNKAKKEYFHVEQITVEFLTTLNQSGFDFYIGSRLYNGADDYFNNYQFVDGWTHNKLVIGTPFFTKRVDTRPELRNLKGGFEGVRPLTISNNRIQLGHFGILSAWNNGSQFRTLISFSRNQGRPITKDPRTPLYQLSCMSELMLPVKFLHGSEIRFIVAIDRGQLLPENMGGWISFRKTITRI